MNDKYPKHLTIMQVPEKGLTSDWLHPIERSFLSAGIRPVTGTGPSLRIIGKILNKAGIFRKVIDCGGEASIVQLAQLTAYRAFPRGIWQEIIPDCFDCWEPDYAKWTDLLQRLAPKVAFFSARQSAAYMEQNVPGLQAIWAPEGIDPTDFTPHKPLRDRTIDVLELGRKNDSYHAAIRDLSSRRPYVHLFEKERGAIVFASRAKLVAGLADSKLSICFPSSITHPGRSGNVETLTQRYLESIASGCILLGRCPVELRDLFGFDPVIAVDEGDPLGQIEHILANIDNYTELTDRALFRLHEVATLEVRTQRMLSQLEARGYHR